MRNALQVLSALSRAAPVAHAVTTYSLPREHVNASSPLKNDAGFFLEDDFKLAYDRQMFTSVHRLETRTAGVCTAFFIAPYYALTAAHCVDDGAPPMISLDDGNGFHSATKTIKIDSFFQAPNYALAQDENHQVYLIGDFAILKLKTPAPADAMIAEIARPDEVKPGLRAMSVGYPGYKFASNARVQDCNCSIRSMYADAIRTDCAIAAGNSGGPLFVETEDGKWKVAGVASTEYADPTTKKRVMGEAYEDRRANYYTNIALYRDAIMKLIARGSTLESTYVKPTYKRETPPQRNSIDSHMR